MARSQPNQRHTHRTDLCAAANMTDLMRRRHAAGKATVVPAVAKAVMFAMCNYAATDGVAWPSIETLAADSDTSTRTVQRVISVMRDAGVIRIVDRSRSSGARKGERHDGSTNLYQIDWDALRSIGDTIENARQTVARSDDSLSSDPSGTHDSGSANARQPERDRTTDRRGSKEEPTGTHIEPPPPPTPQGGDGGGAGEDAHQPSAEQPASVVDEIVAAYPPTHGSLPVSDTEAVHRAIAAERGRADGASAAEILDAVHAYAAAVVAGHVRSPLWCRRWMAERGYEPYVRRARSVEAARRDIAERDNAKRQLVERQVVQTATQVEVVDQILAGRSIEELESVRAEIVADQPNEFLRRMYREANVSSGIIVRREIARRLKAREAVAA